MTSGLSVQMCDDEVCTVGTSAVWIGAEAHAEWTTLGGMRGWPKDGEVGGLVHAAYTCFLCTFLSISEHSYLPGLRPGSLSTHIYLVFSSGSHAFLDGGVNCSTLQLVLLTSLNSPRTTFPKLYYICSPEVIF